MTHISRKADQVSDKARIVLLHHSTGRCIWNGGVPGWFDRYNAANSTAYRIEEMDFPKREPYGWSNYPYDYWNIWVNHAGREPYMGEPTLEMLTARYDTIIWKHCFPVSAVGADSGPGDVADETRTLANYKLQYEALKQKMHQFGCTKFIVWTSAALVEARTNQAQAQRSAEFVRWVRDEWAQDDDNIFVWDFHALETDGGLYLKPDYAQGETNSHPTEEFSAMAAPLLFETIVSAIRSGQ
jgi:hypothetical protein